MDGGKNKLAEFVKKADRNYNNPEYDLPSYPGKPIVNYMICSSPRVGSYLLSGLLLDTGRMGVPHEYFNVVTNVEPLVARLRPRVNEADPLEGYIEALRRVRTTANGVFGIKSHMDHLAPILRFPSVADFVRSCRLVRIQRRDVVGQAVSLYKAWRTGEWWKTREKSSPADDRIADLYDFAGISQAIQKVLSQVRWWDDFLARSGQPHLDVFYEDVVSDTDTQCQKVFRWVTGETWEQGFRLEQSSLKKQGDSVNSQWRQRYLDEYAIRNGLPGADQDALLAHIIGAPDNQSVRSAN